MRRRIAVFASGWNQEMLLEVVKGIEKTPYGEKPDVFVFESFPTFGKGPDAKAEELIYELPKLEGFDGAVIFSAGLESPELGEQIATRVREAGIPGVCLGAKVEGLPVITIDNRGGMVELVTHLVIDHHVQRVAFIAGTVDHVDSIERLAVTREVLERFGLSLPDNDVYYGEWDYKTVCTAVDVIASSGQGLPDAVICANDMMALSAISEFGNLGISVPDDIIVTGFDHIEDGIHAYPTLTTVRQDYVEVGVMCMNILFGGTKDDYVVPTSLSVGESCGCDTKGVAERSRREYCRSLFGKSTREGMESYTRRTIENAIITSYDYETIKANLSYHYIADKFLESDSIFLTLDEKLFSNPSEDTRADYADRIPDEIRVLVAVRGGENVDVERVSREEIIPGYKETKEGHTYFIFPFLSGGAQIGYIGFVDYNYIIIDASVNRYVSCISQAFTRLRINLSLESLNKRLSELYRKDSLTGLFNRFTFDETVTPLFEEQTRNNKCTFVGFMDINYMKQINDKFGHLHGDNAIRICSDAIRSINREKWCGMRYGGDEFMIIGPCESAEEGQQIKDYLLRTISEDERVKALPYKLGVSIGYIITDPSAGKTFRDYVKEADEAMYRDKTSQHEQYKIV